MYAFVEVKALLTGYPVTEDGKEHGEIDGSGGFSDHGVKLGIRAETTCVKKRKFRLFYFISIENYIQVK